MQNSYILLRDHKESGSLSNEELLEIGLKETDLIWVEGQSMDWRSPREIPELKKLVAVRNYNSKINKTEEGVEPELPDSRSQQKKKNTGMQMPGTAAKDFGKYIRVGPSILSAFEKKEIHSQSITGYDSGVIKEAQPGYQLPKKQGNKIVVTNHLPDQVKKCAIYSGLVLAGALLMFLVLNLGGRKAAVVQQTIPSTEKSATSTATTSLNTSPPIPTANVDNPEILSKNSSDSVKKVRKKPVTAPKAIPLITTSNPDSQNIVSNDKEKNIKPVAVINVKPVSFEEISSKIVLKTNDYNVGFLGGVRNLTITLQNNSGYMLYKVTVEVNCLNSSGNIVKTDQINFQSVKAGDAAVMKVDKSNRGVKVKYHITHIECKALGDHQAGEPDPGDSSTN